MDRFFCIAALLAVLLAGISCGKDGPPASGGDPEVRLILRTGGLTVTRASERAGDDALNENAVRRADLFLYPAGGTAGDAVFAVENADLSVSEGAAAVSVSLSSRKVEELTGGGGTCTAYVIVNRPAGTEIGSSTSVPSLKGLTVTAEGFASQAVQEEFVMDGLAELTWDGSRKTLTGDVSLKRAAAKICLTVTDIVQEIEGSDGSRWEPVEEAMTISLHNGAKTAHIDTDLYPYSVRSEDRFQASSAAGGPFYSYPVQWADDIGSEVYLTLLLPWRNVDENTYSPFYYQIPLNPAGQQLVRNTFCEVNVTIGILGSADEKTPVALQPECHILDWDSEAMEAEVNDVRYLVVDRTQIQLNGEDEVSISFASSHPVALEVEVTQQDLAGVVVTTVEIGPERYQYWIDAEEKALWFRHKLKNRTDDGDTDYDYMPYDIVMTVRHQDEPSFSEQIRIRQCPQIYLEAEQNSNFAAGSRYNYYAGYVMVNGYRYVNKVIYNYNGRTSSNTASGLYGGIYGIDNNTGAGNNNPNMYVISNTALTSASQYAIGDPRTAETDNLGSNLWTRALGIDGKNRYLQSYHPAENSDRTLNMIAPVFRVASSYGKTTAGTYTQMQRRCASYQEDGRPAGRWRMPTRAEVEYIVKMSAEGKIPQLFATGTQYWCAQGRVRAEEGGAFDFTAGTGGSSASFVRCVYDDWYWGDETVPVNQFTWGDE